MSKAFKRILKLFLERHAVAFLWIRFFSPKIWFKNQKNMQDNRSLPLKWKQNKKRTVWIEQNGSFISKEWLQDWGSLQILNPDHVASFGLLTFNWAEEDTKEWGQSCSHRLVAEHKDTAFQQKPTRETPTDVSSAVAMNNGFPLNCRAAATLVVLISEIFN